MRKKLILLGSIICAVSAGALTANYLICEKNSIENDVETFNSYGKKHNLVLPKVESNEDYYGFGFTGYDYHASYKVLESDYSLYEKNNLSYTTEIKNDNLAKAKEVFSNAKHLKSAPNWNNNLEIFYTDRMPQGITFTYYHVVYLLDRDQNVIYFSYGNE